MDALAKNMYKQVTEGHKDWHGNLISELVSKCTECGACAEKCPQKIEVVQKLKEVDKILSAL
jgi:predicted aldo/keto reductase-like oxidoreductase